jgi:hypothetical protein
LVAPPSASIAQRVAFGAQTPWHAAEPVPVAMQAWLPQSTGLPHCPAVQV